MEDNVKRLMDAENEANRMVDKINDERYKAYQNIEKHNWIQPDLKPKKRLITIENNEKKNLMNSLRE